MFESKRILRANRIASLIMTVLILVVCPFGASAADGDELVWIPTYISETDAVFLAEDLIQSQYGASHCPWNQTTQIADTVKLFDYEGHANYYLFRLKTDNLQQGYVLVDALSTAPCVEMFGYDGDYMLDTIYQQRYSRKVTTNDHIVAPGGFTFLEASKTRSAASYTYVETGEAVEAAQAELVSAYRSDRAAMSDKGAVQYLNQLRSGVVPLSGGTTSDGMQWAELDNLWNSDYTVYTTGSFSGYSYHSAPVAALNLVYYWDMVRPESVYLIYGHDNVDYIRHVFELMHAGMWTNLLQSGTTLADLHTGMQQYGRAVAHSGTNQFLSFTSTTNLNLYKTQIQLFQRPTLITVRGASTATKDNKSMLVVGTQKHANGSEYLRVLDSASTSKSNFYKLRTEGTLTGNVLDACYMIYS